MIQRVCGSRPCVDSGVALCEALRVRGDGGRHVVSIIVQCENPECRQQMQADEDLQGKRGQCPACGREFRVPGAIGAARMVDAQKFYHLRIEAGPDLVGQAIELNPEKLYEFGKSDSCSHQLPGQSVSRHHCLIQWINDQWIISDLNSTVGTFVNDVRTGRSVLRDNDVIRISKYRIRFAAPRPKATAIVSEPGNHADLPLVVPVTTSSEPGLDLVMTPEQTDAPDAYAGPDPRHQVAQLPGIDFSEKATHARDSARAKFYAKQGIVRIGAIVAIVVVSTALAKLVHHQLTWQPEKKKTVKAAEVVTLAPEMRRRIVALIEGQRFDEARTAMADARTQGATDGDMASLETRLAQGIELQAIAKQLNEIHAQVVTALAEKQWSKANQLLSAAAQLLTANLDLPADVRVASQWQARRDELDRGPIDDLIAKSKAEFEQGQMEHAYATAKDAINMAPNDGPARSWMADLTPRVGAGLHITSSTPDITASLDKKPLRSVTAAIWQLPAGPATLKLDGDAFLPQEIPVELEFGKLITVAADLAAAKPCHVCKADGLFRCRKCAGTGKGICSHCGGTRKEVCSSCKGNWKKTCSTCDGRKRVSATRRCTNCNGSGRVTSRAYQRGRSYSQTQTCSSCNGRGSKATKKRCSACSGKGYQVACHRCNKGKIRCTVCNGSRRHGDCPVCEGSARIDCPRCRGIGKLPADQPEDEVLDVAEQEAQDENAEHPVDDVPDDAVDELDGDASNDADKESSPRLLAAVGSAGRELHAGRRCRCRAAPCLQQCCAEVPLRAIGQDGRNVARSSFG